MADCTIRQLSRHVRWLPADPTTDRPILGAITGTAGTLMVDAGNSPAHAGLFLAELARAGVPAPSFVALTHWHWDHVFGTAALPVPTIAHVETKRAVALMAAQDWSDAALDGRVADGSEIAFCRDMIKAELPDRSGLRLRPPEIGFTHELELDLGGVTCRIIHVGGDHAADSSIVYVPEDGVMFLGDCIYADIYREPRRYTLPRLLPLLAALESYPAECYLPAHHGAPLGRAEFQAEADLLRTVGAIVADCGPDEAAILARIAEHRGAPPTQDEIDVMGEFIAGLDKGESRI
ncbi:MAG TPA: MBL fold metallo-hydrolase [Herpetosiphonaceae bacterium]|nr:MBL fold metallo-hydrolase [Herpetosiphonaceae bacterium]